MPRREQEPDAVTHEGGWQDGDVTETHPAFGKVTLSRVSSSPGASLFDSEILHSHYVVLRIHGADRTRSLQRDWIHTEMTPHIEIAMSEAQWASMVSSFGDGGGTPCTIQATKADGMLPAIPFESRLALSTAETRNAARGVKDRIDAALAAVEEKPTKANVRSLRIAVDQAESNVVFAARSLTEHTENVVSKARADIEAMVDERARAVGLPIEHRPRLGLADDVRALPGVTPAEEDPPGSR
jgi:hypothetical protein